MFRVILLIFIKSIIILILLTKMHVHVTFPKTKAPTMDWYYTFQQNDFRKERS